MERKTAGLLGALAGFAAMGGGQALAAGHPGAESGATPEPMQISSYSDLLRPIPNAVELLKAHDAALQERARNAPPAIQQVDDHHHHHHHEYYYAPPPPPIYYQQYHHHHHHHHHHHSGAIIVFPGVAIGVN
jgi:hypothetical protein